MANAVLAVHVLFIGFVVGAVPLILIGAHRWAWVRSPVFRVVHLAAVAYVAVETWLGRTCPLTAWEAHLRGGSGLDGGFVAYWLHRLFFYALPAWVFEVTYTAFAVLVVALYRQIPPRSP